MGLKTPMTLTVHLPNDLEWRLRERASRDGRSVEDYVLELIERDAVGPGPGPVVDALSLQPGRAETFSMPYRYAWPAELDLMARIGGMRLRERWSGWRREPFTSESASHVSVWEKLPLE